MPVILSVLKRFASISMYRNQMGGMRPSWRWEKSGENYGRLGRRSGNIWWYLINRRGLSKFSNQKKIKLSNKWLSDMTESGWIFSGAPHIYILSFGRWHWNFQIFVIFKTIIVNKTKSRFGDIVGCIAGLPCLLHVYRLIYRISLL